MTRRSASAALPVVLLIFASPAAAQQANTQANTQFWSELTAEWIKSRAWTLKVDVEPKTIVSKPPDQPGWTALAITPAVEYSPWKWVDLTGDMVIGHTNETTDVNTTEVTPRIGLRFQLLSTVRDSLAKEKRPKYRIVLRNYFRTEFRNIHYSDSTPESSSVRVRDRVESEFPLNRLRVTDDGAIYVTGDAEWFWTRHDPKERFASKQRVRMGLGYRASFAWRFEALYVIDRSRDSAQNGFVRADSAIDVRIRRVW